MSMKNSIKHCSTPNLFLHLYYSHVDGYNMQISVGNMKEPLKIALDEEEAENIRKQLDEL